MKKTIETSFKRIETKYIVAKDDVKDLIKDLKEYVVEDDYPTSTISNIYFDTENFEVIQDALAKQHRREKIRMRTYIETPQADSPVFLEVKSKDEEGIGHKFRLVATSQAIINLMTDGTVDQQIQDPDLVQEIQRLRKRYGHRLKPRMFIYYDRLSLKEKKSIQGYPYQKIRVTIDQNLVFRDQAVSLFHGKKGEPLLEDDFVIMEIKAPGQEPQWLKDVLEKYGLVKQKFSKYSCAYHKSQGLDYAPRPVAGTFSLIRFRSATSGSRELIAIFLAMIIGLAAGSGYLLLAILSTLSLLGVWLVLENKQSKADHQRRRHLTITVSKQDAVAEQISQLLDQSCSEIDFISVTTAQAGEQLTLNYEVNMKSNIDDFALANLLINKIENCDVALTKKAKKRKNL